jgi:hypothetical protein
MTTKILDERNALRPLAQEPGKPGFADLDRQPTQIVAVKL